jgi:hypothetical protein
MRSTCLPTASGAGGVRFSRVGRMVLAPPCAALPSSSQHRSGPKGPKKPNAMGRQPEFDPARAYQTVDEKDGPSALNLQFESSKAEAGSHAGGLARAPLSGGVRTATARCACLGLLGCQNGWELKKAADTCAPSRPGPTHGRACA